MLRWQVIANALLLPMRFAQPVQITTTYPVVSMRLCGSWYSCLHGVRRPKRVFDKLSVQANQNRGH